MKAVYHMMVDGTAFCTSGLDLHYRHPGYGFLVPIVCCGCYEEMLQAKDVLEQHDSKLKVTIVDGKCPVGFFDLQVQKIV